MMNNPPTALRRVHGAAQSIRLDTGAWHIIPGTPIYTYCSYWRHWSRRVMAEIRYPFADMPNLGVTNWMEFSLEPIGSSSQSWDEIATMRMRLHGTRRDLGDKITTSLPSKVRDGMMTHLDTELVEFMLVGDIYGSIDWNRFAAAKRTHVGGGGIPFDLFQKG